MTGLTTRRIESLEEFLAHALELEIESAERYRELADNMRVHNNPDVSELFNALAGYGDAHAAEVERRAAGLDLPYIPPWDFKWSCPEGPEAPCLEEMHYQMNTCQALQLALHNEIRGRDFYAQVAAETAVPEVRRAADEMAVEEDVHVAMLRSWIEHEACSARQDPPDLDPPNMPE